MAELTRQLLFVPPARRVEDIYRAETLHDEMDAAQNYPFAFIQYRVTGRRSAELGDDDEQALLVGEAVRPDLRILIDALSRSLQLTLRDGEEAESADQLAARLNVSTKTLTRWRKQGLRWRWVIAPGKKQRHVVYPRKAVEHFLAEHDQLVRRAAKFSQMDAPTRKALLQRARRLADATEVSLNQIATHLARHTGRATETMRLLLEHHDRDHPDDPIFADHTSPLNDAQKRAIAAAHRRGVGVGELTKQYRRSRSTIYRAIRQRQVLALRRVPTGHVASPTFDRPDADEVLLRPLRVVLIDPPEDLPVDQLPAPLAAYYHRPTLAREDQRRGFVRMNYLKYKASRIITTLDDQSATASEVQAAQHCIRGAAAWRDRLIAANLHLVLSAARRHIAGETDHSVNRLLRLLEVGTAVLHQRVRDHDPSRRQTFEAFLTYHLSIAMAHQRQADDASARALPRLSVDTFIQRLPAIRPPA